MVKSLDYLKEAIGRNRDIKGDFGKDLEESKEHGQDETSVIGNTYILYEQNVGGNKNIKDTASMSSERNEGPVIGSRDDPCSIVAVKLAELDSIVVWKIELVSDELGQLTKEISK